MPGESLYSVICASSFFCWELKPFVCWLPAKFVIFLTFSSISPKNLSHVSVEVEVTHSVFLRIDLIVDTFDAECSPVEARIDHTLDGLFRVENVVPAEDESDKLAKLVPTKFQFLPNLDTRKWLDLCKGDASFTQEAASVIFSTQSSTNFLTVSPILHANSQTSPIAMLACQRFLRISLAHLLCVPPSF